MDHAARRARLCLLLPDLGADAFLVTSLPNVRYLTGYTGSNGQLLLRSDGAGTFFTDGRYVEQSRHEVPDLPREIYSDGYANVLARAVAKLDVSRVAFESEAMSYRAYTDLSGISAELVPVEGEVDRLRWVKDEEELASLRAAQAFADAAFDVAIGQLAVGITEREVALELDSAMRREGADGLGFDTILAFGPNAGEPHHQPGTRPLARGDVVKMDFGALVAGYHSDMTRTVAFGEPPARMREIHDIVERAQQAGIDAVRAGVTGNEPDEAARAVVIDAGYEDAFKHSLGHGVGLEIHEGPSLRRGGTDVLPAGAVVTVEPGIYLDGVGGVRIEDMVEVTAEGCRVIPTTTKELIVL